MTYNSYGRFTCVTEFLYRFALFLNQIDNCFLKLSNFFVGKTNNGSVALLYNSRLNLDSKLYFTFTEQRADLFSDFKLKCIRKNATIVVNKKPKIYYYNLI